MSRRDKELMEHYEPEIAAGAESSWSKVLDKYGTRSFYGDRSKAARHEEEPHEMTWTEIQESIDKCAKCKPELIKTSHREPARPPEPAKGDILFISEAPPPPGGFWEEKSADDALRGNLCSILIPQTGSPKFLLDSFRASHFTLVQTMKWPFLGKTVPEIRHSARSHIRYEISFIQPKGIIALGVIAGRALEILYPESSFAKSFKWSGRTLSPEMRSGRHEAGGHQVRITYLPVDRMWNQHADEIRADIKTHVRDLNTSQLGSRTSLSFLGKRRL
jgi:uracil-DNA glycosylase